MEAKILFQKEDKMIFLLKGTNPIMANTIRRIVVDEVPTLAIEEVNFLKNSSALFDEMIAHRMGLVPLVTDLKSYDMGQDCSCKGKGCSKCMVHFTLNVTGPCTVYSEEIKFKDKKIKAAFDKIPITKLLKGQKLDCEGYAILGQGKDHIKFSPGLLFYNYYPKVIINNDKNKLDKFRDKYPSMIFDEKGEFSKDIVNMIIEQPSLADACEGVCDDLVKIERNENNIVFYLESFGQLKPNEIIYAALDMFDRKLSEFEKEVKKLK